MGNNSRREWLKGAAMGAGMVGGAGLTGCGKSEAESLGEQLLRPCGSVNNAGGLNVILHGLILISVEKSSMRLIIPDNVPGHEYKVGCKPVYSSLKPMTDTAYKLTGVTPGSRYVPPANEHIVLPPACGPLGDLKSTKTVSMPFPDWILPFRAVRCFQAMSGKTIEDYKIYPDYLQMILVLRYKSVTSPALLESNGAGVWTMSDCGGGPLNLHIHASRLSTGMSSHLPHLNKLFQAPLDIAVDGKQLPTPTPRDCSAASIGISKDDQRDLMEMGHARPHPLGGGDPSNCVSYIFDNPV